MPTKKNKEPRYRPDPRYLEVRSERITLLVTPTLKSEVRAAAAVLNVSMNEFAHEALEAKAHAVLGEDADKDAIAADEGANND